MSSPSYSFIAGDRGSWEVVSMRTTIGASLESAPFLDVRNEYVMKLPVDFRWLLRGVSSKSKGLRPSDGEVMIPRPQLGRKGACCAAFMPVKRSRDWWSLTDGERREICGRSRDADLRGNPTGMVASRFHHSRELGEPFDFLMWFEYSPGDAALIDEVIASIRESEEWRYVEREADVRLVRMRMRCCGQRSLTS